MTEGNATEKAPSYRQLVELNLAASIFADLVIRHQSLYTIDQMTEFAVTTAKRMANEVLGKETE